MFDFNHRSQKHLQTNKKSNGWRLCGIFHIVEKDVTFSDEGIFTLASSVQEEPVIYKSNDLLSLGKALVDLKKHEFCIT